MAGHDPAEFSCHRRIPANVHLAWCDAERAPVASHIRIEAIRDEILEAAKLADLNFVRFSGYSSLPEGFTQRILSIKASALVIMICILTAYSTWACP